MLKTKRIYREENNTMPYSPIAVDRGNLTIMGVPFPNHDILESTANALGTNMFEGFTPTNKGIELIREYCLCALGRVLVSIHIV